MTGLTSGLFSVFFSSVLVCLFVSCSHQEKPVLTMPPVEVVVQTIEPKTLPVVYEYVGVVQSSHEVEIRARVTGYLETVPYVEGSFVQKGDLLFQIDPRPFQTALDKANAQLAKEQSVLWESQRAVKRFTPLYEQKAASQRDLDNAIASEMSAQAQILEAQALVAEAQLNLEYTTIRSPVSGLTSQAKFRVGSLISQGQDMMTTVSVVDPIWVIFSVSEQDLLRSTHEMDRGRTIFPKNNEFEIELILADKTIFPERGVVNFASPSYSKQTGTLAIRAVLANPKSLLRPGQFVRVRIHGAQRPNAISIPQSAVQQGQKGSFVFVVNGDGQAEPRLIEPGPWDGSNWIIWNGLNRGDLVIIKGVNKVLPGSSVNITHEALSLDNDQKRREPKLETAGGGGSV
ncbi:MAG: efflux RND transporter periplasmic adaptor subunit [Parachlamydiaceae bacterium]